MFSHAPSHLTYSSVQADVHIKHDACSFNQKTQMADTLSGQPQVAEPSAEVAPVHICAAQGQWAGPASLRCGKCS